MTPWQAETHVGSRLLSLDFDGVLHPQMPSSAAEQVPPFCWLPVLAEVLAPHPDVCVLVHSSWRYVYSPDELRDILDSLAPRFVGTAPRGPRYDSVLWWLQLNPRFASVRILDDDASEFPTPPPAELILCDPRMGVSDVHVKTTLTAWLERRLP